MSHYPIIKYYPLILTNQITNKQPMNRREQQPIIYIMLSNNGSSSPTPPPTLIFSRGLYIYAPCPPIF